MYYGMEKHIGSRIEGDEHLKQSIATILTTAIGSRVMRRDFGSNLYKYVDEPMDDATNMAIRTATVEALIRWEPRIAVDRVIVERSESVIFVSLHAQILSSQEYIQTDEIKVAA